MVKIVLHAGMHKTGSNSIQDVFATLDSPQFQYGAGNANNLSWAFKTMFTPEKKMERRFQHVSQGHDLDSLLVKKAEWRARNDTILRNCRKPMALFSAEAISGMKSDAQSDMHAYLSKYSDDIHVFAYVRAPLSMMQSSYQQRLKSTGKYQLRAKIVWPKYRQRLGSLFDHFGTENVHLRRFDPAAFPQGDVVRDFADWIKVSLPSNYCPAHANLSLSLEAVALLYVQRRFGRGYVRGFKWASQKNHAFLALLAQIGQTKFAFSAELMQPVVDQNLDDLAWIERKLGGPLLDELPSAGTGISDEDELINIALRVSPQLALLEGDQAPGEASGSVEALAVRLDRLRAEVAERHTVTVENPTKLLRFGVNRLTKMFIRR